MAKLSDAQRKRREMFKLDVTSISGRRGCGEHVQVDIKGC